MHLERAALQPGSDVAVASYDDTPVAALRRTSVHRHIETIAQDVIDLLLGEIRGMPLAPRRVLVEPSLAVRASSTGLRAGTG